MAPKTSKGAPRKPRTTATDAAVGSGDTHVSLEDVRPYWESLSPEQRVEQLRVSVPELRHWAGCVDDGHVPQPAVPEGEEHIPQPLVDALDGALFRKQVSALHSWREWGCWAHVAALRVGEDEALQQGSEVDAEAPKTFRSPGDLREHLDRFLAVHGGAQGTCNKCSGPLRGVAYRPQVAPPSAPFPADAFPGGGPTARGDDGDAARDPLAAAGDRDAAEGGSDGREGPSDASDAAQTHAAAASATSTAPAPLICEDCLFAAGPGALEHHVAVAGVGLLPHPPGPGTPGAETAAEAKVTGHMVELLDECAKIKRGAALIAAASKDGLVSDATPSPSPGAATAALANGAAAHMNGGHGAGHGVGTTGLGPSGDPASDVEIPQAALQEMIEHVLMSLNELRLSNFAGAEALLQSCVEPLRAAVVAYLPAGQRASTPQVLQTPDLSRLPRHVVAKLAALCEAQVAAFASTSPAPPALDVWALVGDSESGHIHPLPASVASGGGAPPHLGVDWVFHPAGGAQLYPPWQARSAAMHTCLALASSSTVAPQQARSRRFGDLVREAAGLAAERAELGLLSRNAKNALERIMKEFDTRPVVSRATPSKGDMQGASIAVQQAVLAWEDALCAAMYYRYDADAALGGRRATTAQEQLKAAADRLAAAQRAAEAARARDEDEHRRSVKALQKLRGGEGERQRAAASEAFEQRRLLRAHELSALQQKVQAADERMREANHFAETARKQRDSLGSWRDHVKLAAVGLARAATAPEGSPSQVSNASTAATLFRNNRDMFYHDSHYTSLLTDLKQRVRECDVAAEELAAVCWRLGQQLLALACDDGDTLITTRLAVPLLRKRLGAAAAARQAEAAQRAYDVLLAEEAAAEAAAREKSAQEAARRAAKKSVKKAAAASSNGNGNADAGSADANGEGHNDDAGASHTQAAPTAGAAPHAGADELRASREAALAAKRAKEEEEREAALEERRRQLLASDDAFWRAREEADTAAAIAASSAEAAGNRGPANGAEPRGGKTVSNGHAPPAAAATGKPGRGSKGGDAERSAGSDKAAPHPANAVATQPQVASGKGGAAAAKPAGRDRGGASHAPAVEVLPGSASDRDGRAPPKGAAAAAAAAPATQTAIFATHQAAIAAAVASMKARPLPTPRSLQHPQQQGGDKAPGAAASVEAPAKEHHPSPSLEAAVQRALAAKDHKPGLPGDEAAGAPAVPPAGPSKPATNAAPSPPPPPPPPPPPASSAASQGSSALRVNAAEFVPSSGLSVTPPPGVGTPPMGPSLVPPQMMGPPPPGGQPPLFFGMAAPLAPPPPGVLPIGASFPIPGAPGYSWLVSPHGYVAIGPTGVPLVPQMVPPPGGPPQGQQPGVGSGAQGGPPMLWPPGPVPPPAGTVPWVPLAPFGAMPPVPLDAQGSMVMMPSVTPPLPLGPPSTAPGAASEPPAPPTPGESASSASNANASRALMQLLMSGTTATSLPPPPPTQAAAAPPVEVSTPAELAHPALPEAPAPPVDGDARALPPGPGSSSSNYTTAVSGGGGRLQAVTKPTPRRPTAPAGGPPPPPVPRLASPTPTPAAAPAAAPAAPPAGGQQQLGGRSDTLSAALVALHASAAVRAATLALPLPPHTGASQPCPVRAVRTLFASAETRGFHGNHLANLLASASSALAAAQPPAAASQPVSAANAVQAVVQALTSASGSSTGALALCDALCPDVASATSCGTCGAVTPVPAPAAGSVHPGACVRHVSAGGLSMVRALLGPHAPIASLLRELGAQEPAPCGAPGCGAAACAVRRSVRVVPPAVCLGIEWADLQAGAGPQGVAPSDMTSVLDALVSPLDVPASYSDAGAPSGGSAGGGGASGVDRSAVHSLRALVLAPSPGSSRSHVVYTLPAEATSGWAMQYPPATGDRSGDSHGHGPTPGAPRDLKLSWAALKAKCVKDGLTPVVALFTRDA